MPVNFMDELRWGEAFEREAAQLYASKRWPGSVVYKTPKRADLDFIVVDPETGTHLAYVEVKTRRIPSTQYESTIVSWRKYEAATFNRRYNQVPTVCIIVFTDGFATFDLHQKPDDRQEITRYDRMSTASHALYLHSRMEFHPDLAAGMVLPTA